jgi:SAM-dependent methyltransferase
VPEALEPVLDEIRALILSDSLSRAVFSGRRRNAQPDFKRVDVRPVLIRGAVHLQVVRTDERQATTSNHSAEEVRPVIDELLGAGYGNLLVETTELSVQVRVTKKGLAQVHRAEVGREVNLSHDRDKMRLIDPEDPLLRVLGISDAQGRIKPSRQDKYRQVEEFLRLLAPALQDAIYAGHIPAPTSDRPLRVVDLGCGHAYLTFAAHQYLRSLGMPVHVIGIDVREDSRDHNRRVADELGVTATMEFRAESIDQTAAFDDCVDVAIALHACDTATDDALAWAAHRNAGLILSAPCCHHDLQKQLSGGVSPEPFAVLTRHGLLRERWADLLTDTFRAHLLRLIGYRVEVVEFVAGEHTPRNLLIRATRTRAHADSTEWTRYDALKAQWQVVPALEPRLGSLLDRAQ